MKQIKQILGGDLRQYTMVLALAILIIFFNVISGGRMLTSSNIQNLLSGNAYVLVLALGMLMVIVIGQIDLSVGSVAGFTAMSMAILANKYNLPWFVAVLMARVLPGKAWHPRLHYHAGRYVDVPRRRDLDLTVHFRSGTGRIEILWRRISS